MKNIKHFAQRYVDWVIRLGRVRFSLLGIIILAVFALCTQIVFSLFIIERISWVDIVRSVTFGLLTAPFVIYFFTLLVEKLERSRLELAHSVENLKTEVSERIIAQQQLSQALSQLEQHNRDKSTLLATISHELRTPLNGIVGLSQILLDEELSDRQRNYLKTINISAVSLGYIFSDIIDLEKFDSSRLELNIKPTDFPALINDIYNVAEFMAKQKNLNFHLIVEDNLPNWLDLDPVRVSQILWNLISNAVKFTDQGDITLKISRIGQQYQFSLSDTGMGIAQEELPHIFKLYYQVKESRRQSAGSGIGLAVSKNLAQLMQGDLRVESELGKGSTFYLTIIAPESAHISESTNQMPALHILLVEDVELNILVAKTILEKLGHRVDVATCGQQAIQLFEQNIYDLLLLDIKLPDMTGFEIAQHLRQNYEQDIYDFLPPLVAFTANVMQTEQEYLELGMDGVLRKPISIEELQHCLQQFFGDMVIEPAGLQPAAESSDFDLSLIEILGKTQMQANIALFKQTMPQYLAEMAQSDLAIVSEIAHKIKGAAASLGIINLRQIAEKIEHNPSHTLVVQLNNKWESAVKKLEDYLADKA